MSDQPVVLAPGELSWDLTDPHMPQPRIWPVCTECDTAFSYVWGLNFSTGKVQWTWHRECKHKKAGMEMHDGRPGAPDTEVQHYSRLGE